MKRLLIIISLFAAVFATAGIASANSSYFVASTYCTSSATSSKTQVFPGQATTTCVFDSYNISSTQAGVAQPADSATLLVQQTASGTTAVLNIFFEHSHDGIDWYGDAVDLSTTTVSASLLSNKSYAWAAGSTGVQKKAITMSVPARYTRISFTATTATTSVWAQIVPKRQVRE